MIAGMIPMALGLGEGGEQTAPLGRAVIGGLAAATLATLLILPCVFAILQSGRPTGSGSLEPEEATTATAPNPDSEGVTEIMNASARARAAASLWGGVILFSGGLPRGPGVLGRRTLAPARDGERRSGPQGPDQPDDRASGDDPPPRSRPCSMPRWPAT